MISERLWTNGKSVITICEVLGIRTIFAELVPKVSLSIRWFLSSKQGKPWCVHCSCKISKSVAFGLK